MLVGAKGVFCVSGATVLAAVLALGPLHAGADEPVAWPAFDRPGVSLLAGLERCAPTLRDNVSGGSRCFVGWSVNDLLLDAAARLATERGRAVFGKHFRIVNNLSYSPVGNGLDGGLDVVLPFGGGSTSQGGRLASASLVQHRRCMERVRHTRRQTGTSFKILNAVGREAKAAAVGGPGPCRRRSEVICHRSVESGGECWRDPGGAT